MKLNAYILVDKMRGVSAAQLHSSPIEARLRYVTILDERLPIRSDYIYLATAANIPILPEIHGSYTLVCAGNVPLRYKEDKNCDLICCRKEYTISMLFDMIGEILFKYDEWEQSLQDALVTKRSLENLCQLSIPIFENPMMILGENHELLAVGELGERYRFPYEYRQKDTDFLSEKILEDLLLDSEYPKTFSNQTPDFYTGADGIQCIYINIFIDDRYAARICIDGITRDMNDADKISLCVFSGIIKSALQERTQSSYSSLVNLKKHVKQCIIKGNSNQEIIGKNLKQIHWLQQDPYFCIVLEPDQMEFQGRSIIHDCNMLEKKYPGCIAMDMDTDILLLCNLRICPFNPKELRADMVYTIRERLMKSGISTPFHDFYDIGIYYKQSKAALETGKEYDEMLWQYEFMDYALPFVINHGVRALHIKALLPQGLKYILQYDKDHGTSYYTTLRTFVEQDMSTAKAIDSLFVHRSTFKYRMKRVLEMLQMDLDKPETKLYLMILFRILDH